MNLEAFDVLRQHETTSWACWSENEDCSVEFFRSQISRLHGRAIFVGLNRSESWQEDLESDHMSNFHTPGHVGDGRLKRHIQTARLANLIGGLMTDVSEEVKTDSGVVKVDAQDATSMLIKKILLTGAETNRAVICFGDKTFNTIKTGLVVPRGRVSVNVSSKTRQFVGNVNQEAWSVFRVWHPSNYGRFIHKSEIELPIQLSYINSQMNKPQ